MILQQRPDLLNTRPAAGHRHLLAALAVADLRLRRAIDAARRSGFGELTDLRGLFVGDDQVDRLLGQPIGSRLWQQPNGHSPHAEPVSEETRWQDGLDQAHLQWQAVQENGRADGLPMPLDLLVRRFSLSPLETEILLLALLPELDLRYEPLLAYLQDDVTRKRPSVNLLLDLLATSPAEKLALRELFAPDGRLRRTQLIACQPPSGQPEAPLLAQFVSPAASVVAFLLGQETLDPALANSATLHVGVALTSPPGILEARLSQLQRAATSSPIFAFEGPYGAGKRATAAHLAAKAGQPLLTLSLPHLAGSEVGLLPGIAAAVRDGRLHAAALYLTGWDSVLPQEHPPEALWQMLLAYPHTVIIAGTNGWQPRRHLHQRPIHVVSFSAIDYQSRLKIWQQHLAPQKCSINLPQLANLFHFTPGQIEDVVATARNLAGWRQDEVLEADLYTAARLHSNQRLNQLAVKISPRYTWDDIVLPADTLAQLHELVQRVRQQPTVYQEWGFGPRLATGKGVAALFAGESGTGKTMAADVVAGELGLELYKIDLSALVSKYIGETEKNLERVFSEAATSNAILFFDEADALFGKRSEVRDSHDRYANMEVSYLLQRLETYAGVVILASNLQANMDDAFTRRLHFIIEFPLPQTAERERIWRVHFPADTPVAAEVDLALLARRFAVAGGHIRNMIVRAAFLAAAENGPVRMRHLLHAARREYQKLGRLLEESLFTPEHDQP